MTTSSHPTKLASLPTELLIDTISTVPWTAFEPRNLKLVCRGFNDVLSNYEHSIVSRLIETQIPSSILHRFPDLVQGGRGHGYSYHTLEVIQSRWEILKYIEKSCYDVKERHCKQAERMTPGRVTLQGIGLCSLYRLSNHSGKGTAPWHFGFSVADDSKASTKTEPRSSDPYHYHPLQYWFSL
ncbi:hypothetical protein BDV97DRAFT_18640 [Delphinella strobiligena]|nr:hypothetical protein BDV97DRAFT_18640 [Delphinella strobiligena]